MSISEGKLTGCLEGVCAGGLHASSTSVLGSHRFTESPCTERRAVAFQGGEGVGGDEVCSHCRDLLKNLDSVCPFQDTHGVWCVCECVYV